MGAVQAFLNDILHFDEAADEGCPVMNNMSLFERSGDDGCPRFIDILIFEVVDYEGCPGLNSRERVIDSRGLCMHEQYVAV